MRFPLLSVGLAAAMLQLSGCGFVVAEAVGNRTKMEREVSGEYISNYADWSETENQSVASSTGTRDWVCARTNDGGKGCIATEDFTQSNFEPSVYFNCWRGEGGFISGLIDDQMHTYFCEKA